MKLFLMKSTEKSYFFAGLSVLLWSTVATSFKLGLSELDYIQLIFFASATSVVVLFFILLIQGKVKLLLAQSPKQIGYSVMLGIFKSANLLFGFVQSLLAFAGAAGAAA
jgi:uncharacterized membrane protein